MRALILAAGRGERMRPLSDATPKPLLVAGGKRLIEWQIEALARAGVRQIVVNTAHLPAQFAPALGDGSRCGVQVAYSPEGTQAEHALETRGGIVQALPLLIDPADPECPFIVASGDVVTDFDYARLHTPATEMRAGRLDAHLVLVDNPPFHRGGDMGLVAGRIAPDAVPRLTYANIALFAPRLFAGLPAVRAKLFPWLYEAARAGRVGGEHFRGRWFNVGTPAELAALDRDLRSVPLAAG
jgi:MurNAc alpha-1-phosphate uridylyltransferase